MARKAAVKSSKTPAPVFDYSKSRIAFKRSYEEFQAFLAGYPDSTGVCAYLYRLWPVVDLKKLCPPGEDETKWGTNIEKIVDLDLLDPAAVAERHGSGEYMVKVSDSNRVRGETEVCRAWLSVNNPELTARLDIRTLVLAHPKNESYVQQLVAEGKLEMQDGRAVIPRSSRAIAGAGPIAVSAGGYTVDARLDRIEAAILGKTPAADGTLGTLHQMRELKGLLDSMAPAGRGGDDLDRLEKLAKVLRSVAPVHDGAPAIAAVDPIDNYRRVKDLLADITPAAISVAGEGWGSMIRDIAAAAPALVQTFLILRNAGGVAVRPPAASPVPPVMVGAPPVVPAAAASVGGPAAAAAGPDAAAPVGIPFMEPLPAGFDIMALTSDPARMARLMQVAEQLIGKFRRGGVKGFDCAYSVYWTEPDGPTIWSVCETIARGADGELSPEPLLMVFGYHPAASDLVLTRAAEFREWLDDFLNFVPEVAETAAVA